MKTSDFDFNLPPELIAQTPLANRTASRMMRVRTEPMNIEHLHFYDCLKLFKPGDVLVRNNSKVIPARLFGIKADTGAAIEILLISQTDNQWKCMVKKASKIKVGTQIVFGDGELLATCTQVKDEGIRFFEFSFEGIFLEILAKLGKMPLPPYIKETLAESERYQTVYSKVPGSVAAPTAGLHFTDELLDEIKAMGVIVCDVTLHVGLGTFKPVSATDLLDHQMHEENFEMSQETANILTQAKLENRRIIAVGTTTLRVLESVYQKHSAFVADDGWTDIFIYPGIEVLSIDILITNFHLPQSTLLMLVSAFISKEAMFAAYQVAIEHKYRFFSFGDAMWLEKPSLRSE